MAGMKEAPVKPRKSGSSRRNRSESNRKKTKTSKKKDNGAPSSESVRPKEETSAPAKEGNNVRRLLHKFKETIGITDKTEHPKALLQSFDEVDNYFKALEPLVELLSNAIQPNPKFRKEGDPKILVEAPAGQDEFEVLLAYLGSEKKDFEDYGPSYKQICDIVSNLALEHRKFQVEARKSVHYIRTFVRYHYPVLAQHREDLDKKREEMDFARQQLNAAKDQQTIEQRAKIKDLAQKEYQEKIKVVQCELNKLPEQKDLHVKDLVNWGKEMKKFHDKTNKYLAQVEALKKK